MEPIRTDLAVERTAAAPSLPGVTQETRGNAFSVTEIRIKNDENFCRRRAVFFWQGWETVPLRQTLWVPASLRKCWQRGTSAPPSLRRNSPIYRNCGQSVCLPAVCWGRPAWSRQN